MLASHAGRELAVDNAVLASERSHGQRNRAMALLMQAAGAVSARVEESLELYLTQCSTLVTTDDLSVMAATLANGGVNPLTGEVALQGDVVTDVLAVMYDQAGQWSVQVGLPAKSGVAGGILAVAPGRLGIGVYSPPLDPVGNSVRGIAAVTSLSRDLGLHVLDPHPEDKVAELRSSRRPPTTA
jgi:glutaminase